MHELRPFQKEALSALRHPRHVICVAPTGAGKSLIYEEHVRRSGEKLLLVTPLVALARQQFQNLSSMEIATSLGIGGQRPDHNPNTRVWIVSPEALQSSRRYEQIQAWGPEILVVDECHCIWEWGEDFRPAFLAIPKLLDAMKIKKSLWLTATLPASARQDLLRRLPPEQTVQIGRFELPPGFNLFCTQTHPGQKSLRLLQWIEHNREGGLIFSPTRQMTERLARLVQSATPRKVLTYHAGMSEEERRLIESRLGSDATEILIATSAFGMGMNFSHIRWVVLWDPPFSLLALTQAIGRAGRRRDTPGKALILWNPEDFHLCEWATRYSSKKRAELHWVAGFLRSFPEERAFLERYFNA